MKQLIALMMLVTLGVTDAFAKREPRRGGGSGSVSRGSGSNSGSSSRTRTERTRPSNGGNSSRTRTERNRDNNRGTVNRNNNRRNDNRTVNNPRRPRRGQHYGTRRNHTPYRYTSRTYNRYFHSPVTRRYNHHRRWNTRYSYTNYLRSSFRNYIYLNWLFYPSTRVNGHYYVDNYPYYVHNGYRHRYSNVDMCNYQLVDKDTHTIARKYGYQSCVTGYNRCALDRDRRNEMSWDNKYFCAETTGNDDNYGDHYSSNDGYYNNDYNTSDDCYDYDYDSGICYDNY